LSLPTISTTNLSTKTGREPTTHSTKVVLTSPTTNRANYLFKRLKIKVYTDKMKRGFIGNTNLKEHAEDIAERVADSKGVNIKGAKVGSSLRVCAQCTAGVCAKHNMQIVRR
jgi:hypothetical protein